MSTYVSVDLDYWLNYETQNSATNFFEQLLDLHVPTTFVIEHEELVADMNKMKNLTRMYNVDYHSDIVAQHDREEKPQDYEWANHVNRRTKAHFTWIMPNVKCYTEHHGTCHGEGPDPFVKRNKSGWKSCSKQVGLRHVNLKNVERIGVCLSPCFITTFPVEKVLSMLDVSIYKVFGLIQRQPWNATKRKRGILKEIAA